MKFQVAFVSLLVLAISANANSQAAGAGPVGPPSFCQIHLNILQTEANKVNTPDLPADLKLRIDDVLANAAAGCSNCDGLLIWQNKVCLVMNLRLGLNQLSVIKAEADARATTTAAAPAQ